MKTRLVSVAIIIALGVSTLQARGDDRHDDYNRHDHHHFPMPHHGHNSHHHSAARWVVPLVLGGVVGYTLSRPEQTRVVAYSAPTYQEEWVYSRDCDCKRRVLVEVR